LSSHIENNFFLKLIIFIKQSSFQPSHQYNSHSIETGDYENLHHLQSKTTKNIIRKSSNNSLNANLNPKRIWERAQSSNPKEIFYNKNRFNNNPLNTKNQTSHNRLFNELQMTCCRSNTSVLETLLNSSCNVQDYKASYLSKNILDLSGNNNNSNNINRTRLNSKSREKNAFSPKQKQHLVYYSEPPRENLLFENTINLNSIENNTQGFNINYDPVREQPTIKFAFSNKNGFGNLANNNNENYNENNNNNNNNNENDRKTNKLLFHNSRFSPNCNSSSVNNINLNIQKNSYAFYFNMKERKENNSIGAAAAKKNKGINNNPSINNLNINTNNDLVTFHNTEPMATNFNNEVNFDSHVGINSSHKNNFESLDVCENSNQMVNYNMNTAAANRFRKGAAYEKDINAECQTQLQSHKKHYSVSSFLLRRETNDSNNYQQNELSDKQKNLFRNTRNKTNFNNNNNYKNNCSSNNAKREEVIIANINNINNSCHNKNNINLNCDKTYKLIEANKKFVQNNYKNKNQNSSSYIENNNNNNTNSNKEKTFFINTNKRHCYNNYQEPGYYTKKSKSKEKSKSKNNQITQKENIISEIKNVDLFDLKIRKGNFVVEDQELRSNRILNDISAVSAQNNLRAFSENCDKHDSLLVPDSICFRSALELQEAKISPIASPKNEPKFGHNCDCEIDHQNNKFNFDERSKSGNFNINNRAVSNLLSEDPSLIYGNAAADCFNQNNYNDDCSILNEKKNSKEAAPGLKYII